LYYMYMYWKRFLICLVVFSSVLSLLVSFPSKANAGCLRGATCLGQTVVDFKNGCRASSPAGYCNQSYSYNTVTCDSNCSYNVGGVGLLCCNYGTSCAPYWCTDTHSGSCCSACTPSWSACSASCGGGTRDDGCGTTEACNTQPCCSPVNGAWTDWGACTSCSQTRTCTNPAPSCGGSSCTGDATQSCGLVDGGWTAWGVCIGGVQTRTCTNPAPLCGGTCIGSATQSCAVNPWWQVIDGDVSTNGDLYSAVP
jgi:hypothetical protein